MESRKKVVKLILFHLLMGTIVATVVLLTNGFCLFKYVTKIDCPGCGLTRAFLAAFRGDFKAAIGYHEMFWAMPILFLLAGHVGVVRKKCSKTVYTVWIVALSLLMAALLVRYIVKMVLLYT